MAAVLLLAVIAAAVVASGWYWLNRPISDDALAVEAAVADGSLVAIGHIDAARIVQLKSLWFGADDPGPIPIGEDDRALLDNLFSGDANFSERLEHVLFAVNVPADGNGAQSTLVLTGTFDVAAVRDTLAAEFQLEPLDDGGWSMLRKPKQPRGRVCPEPETKALQSRPSPAPHYLVITPQRVVVASSRAWADRIEHRLIDAAPAAQVLEEWRNYRRGQLASFMVFTPTEASKAVNGLPGLAARKAATDAPHISRVAARVGVAPLKAGLHAELGLTSSDPAWNAEQGTKLRQRLESLSQDSRSVSRSLGRLLSRVSVADAPESLQIHVALDQAVMSELGRTVQEAFAGIFTVKVADSGQQAGPVVDQIMQNVTDYEANAALAQLPPYEPASYEAPPLFVKDSFMATLVSVTRNDEGLFELKVKGETALPKVDFNTWRAGSLTFSIEDVTDRQGASLLRDEQCVELRWGKRNHEPVVNESLLGDKLSAEKTVRLAEGAVPGDVAAIRGRLEFAAPVQVKRFALPLDAGGTVEHMGLRFFVNRVGEDGNVSYQISGDKERFAELRALNREGKPLRSDWTMGDVEGGRLTRHFNGTIKSLEVYVVERFAKQQVAFALGDLFVAPAGKEEEARPPWLFAPEAISGRLWQQYAALDMKRLHADPKDEEWHRWDRLGAPLASLVKAPVELVVAHEVQEWGNNPKLSIHYPMIPELPGVLSALSYRIDEPAREKTGVDRYHPIFYPYYSVKGEKTAHLHIQHQLDGKPFAGQQFSLIAGLEKEERLQRLAGRIRFRLPTRTAATRIGFDELWQGRSVDGVTVSLTAIDRGMFPGYALKIEGAIERLVNLHGIAPDGALVLAHPINFQDDGYWTMTLPFTPGMQEVELVLATEQAVYDYPFDFKPEYPRPAE